MKDSRRLAGIVRRLGRIETAALLSLIWALPMAAWAGSVDLEPGPLPWLAFAVGLVLLAVWLILVRAINRLPQRFGPGRYRVREMTALEVRWNGLLLLSGTLLIGWLNGAATVDWAPLIRLARAGRPGPVVLLVGLLILLALLLVTPAISWKRARAAFEQRRERAESAPCRVHLGPDHGGAT